MGMDNWFASPIVTPQVTSAPKVTRSGSTDMDLDMYLGTEESQIWTWAQSKPPGFSFRTHRKCIKCREWKITKQDFGAHGEGEYQTICKVCKREMLDKTKFADPVKRLRHHTATRCLTQLGVCAPLGFVGDLEKYLGYTFEKLTRILREELKSREGNDRKLGDALEEGYHIDHIKPLMLYKVVSDDGGVDWEQFRECWKPSNLRAIPGLENLVKGAKY